MVRDVGEVVLQLKRLYDHFVIHIYKENNRLLNCNGNTANGKHIFMLKLTIRSKLTVVLQSFSRVSRYPFIEGHEA